MTLFGSHSLWKYIYIYIVTLGWTVYLFYHRPSAYGPWLSKLQILGRVFTWKILFPFVPCTIQWGLLLCNFILLLQQHLLCSGSEKEKTAFLPIRHVFITHKHCFGDVFNLLCRSTPSSQWALSRSVAGAEASGTPASSPRALVLWQILCQNIYRNTLYTETQINQAITCSSEIKCKELNIIKTDKTCFNRTELKTNANVCFHPHFGAMMAVRQSTSDFLWCEIICNHMQNWDGQI